MRYRQSGRWKKGFHRMQNNNASNETCICPECGYSKPHVPGLPCRTEQCPNCHIPLARNDSFSYNSNKENKHTSSQHKSETINFPKVNQDICTGCGICIDNCPTGAIELVNDIAFIDEKKCSNCRQCENDCPVEAIS
jgi:ferredoxin